MRTFRGCAIAVLLLVSLAAGARSQGSVRSMTWEDCVAVARKSNPDIAAARGAMEAGRASYYGSFNGLLPQASLTHSYSNSNNTAGVAGADHWQAEGSVGLNVFNAGRLADVQTASANLSEAEAGYRLASAAVRFNLRQAFAQLLYARMNVEVSKTILDMRQTSAQMVSLRYNSGQESKGNMMRSNAQALQARTDLAQAQRSLRTAQIALDRQLGLDDFTILDASGALEAAAAPDFPGGMSSYVDARPDVALQEAVVKFDKAGLNQARGSLWPSLSASYARTRSGGTEFPNSQYGWTVGGLLSYPIFGGGPTATYFAVSAARRTLEKSQQDLRTARDAAALDLASNWASFAGAVDQVRVQTALLDAARQRNDEADITYASGLLTYNNWEIIASDRISQERLAVQARLNAVDAQAAWEKALGKPLGE